VTGHTVTVFPAGGDFASKSVDMLKPLVQQFLVLGVFVQAPSCRSMRVLRGSGEPSIGMRPAKAREPKDSQ
jgi:hypothetical protein